MLRMPGCATGRLFSRGAPEWRRNHRQHARESGLAGMEQEEISAFSLWEILRIKLRISRSFAGLPSRLCPESLAGNVTGATKRIDQTSESLGAAAAESKWQVAGEERGSQARDQSVT